MTEYLFMPELSAKGPHNTENMISFHTLNLSYPWVESGNSEGHEQKKKKKNTKIPPNQALARQGHGQKETK